MCSECLCLWVGGGRRARARAATRTRGGEPRTRGGERGRARGGGSSRRARARARPSTPGGGARTRGGDGSGVGGGGSSCQRARARAALRTRGGGSGCSGGGRGGSRGMRMACAPNLKLDSHRYMGRNALVHRIASHVLWHRAWRSDPGAPPSGRTLPSGDRLAGGASGSAALQMSFASRTTRCIASTLLMNS